MKKECYAEKLDSEIYEKLDEVSENFRNLETLFDCLDKSINENFDYSESKTADLFGIVKKILMKTKKQFEDIEEMLNI